MVLKTVWKEKLAVSEVEYLSNAGFISNEFGGSVIVKISVVQSETT